MNPIENFLSYLSFDTLVAVTQGSVAIAAAGVVYVVYKLTKKVKK